MGDAALIHLRLSLAVGIATKFQTIGESWSQKCGNIPIIPHSDDRLYFAWELLVTPIKETPEWLMEFASCDTKYSGGFNAKSPWGSISDGKKDDGDGEANCPDIRQIFMASAQLLRTIKQRGVSITLELLETFNMQFSVATAYCSSDSSLKVVLLSLLAEYLPQF